MTEFRIIEDTYCFACHMCGNCCTGDQIVHLNPYDLYKMARYLSYERTGVLFRNNYVRLQKSENLSWQPVIRFRQKPFKFCPFLSNEADEQGNLIGLCELHPESKPLICALAPVGRIADLGKPADDFIFVKPAPDCLGVESKKINRLTDVIAIHERELAYQRRFFHLLERCVEAGLKKNQYYDYLYDFPVTTFFDEQLGKMERRLAEL